MSDTSSPTPGTAEAIERTPTGEIVDQTPATPTAEPTSIEEAKPPSVLNEEAPKEDSGPPDKYEFKLPEGAKLDEATMTEATKLFKDLGLGQKGAQQLVDFYVNKMQEVAEAPVKLWEDTQKQWQSEIKNDKELGPRLAEVRTTVAKAIDGLGNPTLAAEFRKAMDITGAGNNPAFVRAFYKLAQQVTEGHSVAGRGPAPAGQKAPGERPPTAAAAIYPNHP